MMICVPAPKRAMHQEFVRRPGYKFHHQDCTEA